MLKFSIRMVEFFGSIFLLSSLLIMGLYAVLLTIGAFGYHGVVKTVMEHTMENPVFWVIPGWAVFGLIISSLFASALDENGF